jgi:1,4-dihydroxy-2-naphthoyl-CoA hydrolase
MAIWKTTPTLDLLNGSRGGGLPNHLGIETIEIGDDFIVMRMPVDTRTHQPYGILHGGASCVLAETLGSVAGSFCVDLEKKIVVGLEINANHISSVRSGFVYGTVRPIHIGRSTHVWDIQIKTEDGKLVCVSRLTLAVIDRP